MDGLSATAQKLLTARAVASRAFDAQAMAIGTGLAQVTPSGIVCYYRHCGYPLRDRKPQPF